MGTNDVGMAEKIKMAEAVKYSAIVVSSIPMLIIYPFVQKYFVKGVMIGAVKGWAGIRQYQELMMVYYEEFGGLFYEQ